MDEAQAVETFKPRTVRELYGDASRWTQGTFARRRARKDVGEVTVITDPEAYSFCLGGAVRRIYGWNKEGQDAMLKVQKALEMHAVSTWNDNPFRTFQQVKDLVVKLDI